MKSIMKNNLNKDKVNDIFALAIYGLIIYPKTLGHVEMAAVKLFARLGYNINFLSVIVVETI